MPKGQKGFQKGHGFFANEQIRRKKISEKLKGKIPKNFQEIQQKSWELKRGVPIAGRRKIGWKLSEISKQNISRAMKGKLPKNIALLLKSSEKIRFQKGQNKGEKSSNWKGGITPINQIIRSSLEYKLWRKSVFERDKYACVWCGIGGNQTGGYLEADHIKPFSLFPELRFAIDNGRTLCKPCHRKTSTYGNKIRFMI